MTANQIEATVHNNILTVTLNRPDKKNALSDEMYVDLTRNLRRADEDDDIHIVVLQGAGDAFCCGTDFSGFSESRKPGDVHPAVEFVTALMEAKKPIIAAVHGVAIGVGATMLLHCDVILAAEGTRFRFPFADLGMVPEAVSTLLLPASVGYHRAARLFFESDFVDARYMADIGLVSEMTPSAELRSRARALAERLSKKSTVALTATKKLLRHTTEEMKERAALEFSELARILSDRGSFEQRFSAYKAKM